MKNVFKISIIAIVAIFIQSCAKDEMLVIKNVEAVKRDSTESKTPYISGWGEGKGDTNNGEGE